MTMSGPAPEVGTSTISDHPFVPRGEWWTTCGYWKPGTTDRCGLAEAAHDTSTLTHEPVVVLKHEEVRDA